MMIGRVDRSPYPIPGYTPSEEEMIFEKILDIAEGKVEGVSPPPPKIPVRIISRDRWGSLEIVLLKVHKADYLRVKRWMIKAGLMSQENQGGGK